MVFYTFYVIFRFKIIHTILQLEKKHQKLKNYLCITIIILIN